MEESLAAIRVTSDVQHWPPASASSTTQGFHASPPSELHATLEGWLLASGFWLELGAWSEARWLAKCECDAVACSPLKPLKAFKPSKPFKPLKPLRQNAISDSGIRDADETGMDTIPWTRAKCGRQRGLKDEDDDDARRRSPPSSPPPSSPSAVVSPYAVPAYVRDTPVLFLFVLIGIPRQMVVCDCDLLRHRQGRRSKEKHSSPIPLTWRVASPER